jgi:ADP-ribosyl-[dinitrogen reductase] hydrolase
MANRLIKDRYRGCLLGLASGDAVGTTVEFKKRGTFEPVTDMVGGGPFDLQPGEWTDDTSMALCLARSLLDMNGFDAKDQIDRYLAWWETGYLSSIGECFDIGNTTRHSLIKYKETQEPFSGSQDPRTSGNGSIMRLAPVPMYFSLDMEAAIHYSAESSRTTHGSQECLDACKLLGYILVKAINGYKKEDLLSDFDPGLVESGSIKKIANREFLNKSRDEILGTGYVVKSLEAALWCFSNTNSFREAILLAVNLGDDADTTGAVCGQISGAYYGESNIPEEWLKKLVMVNEIRDICDALMIAKHQ